MLKQLFAPTKGNLLGWAAAAAVVGAWQYFTSGPDAVDDTLAYNQKIINENKKKPWPKKGRPASVSWTGTASASIVK